MEIKCGTDIIEIDRIKDSIEELGDKFLDRIFTKKEIEYCESKNAQKYEHYAVRFAAKEAGFKALSYNLENKYQVSWKDIEDVKEKQGRPTLNIKNIDMEKVESIDISLSHCRNYAIANVTVLIK